MKKYMLPVVLVLLPVVLFAQPNNPYNQAGIDYVSSLALIQSDFTTGKVKEFNEETVNYYSKQLPLKTQASVDLVASVVNNFTNPNFSYTAVINKSSLSDYSKNLFKGIIDNKSRLDNYGFRGNLSVKADEVLTTSIPAPEKELVLSLIAVAYHVADPVNALTGRQSGQGGCWIDGPNGSGPGTPEQCAAAGALIGGIIGFSICGFWCALGGAVIGGVAGALS